jgi:hypothetical protein
MAQGLITMRLIQRSGVQGEGGGRFTFFIAWDRVLAKRADLAGMCCGSINNYGWIMLLLERKRGHSQSAADALA